MTIKYKQMNASTTREVVLPFNIKVSQFQNDKGVAVKNQFKIEYKDKEGFMVYVFQSYDSIIAIKYVEITDDKVSERIVLDSTYWDYSKTTGKYRNLFLGEDKKETERKIKEGIYQLCELN